MAMNDFTKEELQIILLDMNFYAKNKKFKCLIEAHSHVECREKIQFLIDNYCEHEKIQYVGDVHGYNCKRCDKSFTGADIDADRHMSIIEGEE